MNELEDLFDAIVSPTDVNYEADTHGLVRNLVQRVASWPVTSGHWSLRRTSGLAAVAVLHAQEVLQLVPEQRRASSETALELAELVFGGECKPLPCLPSFRGVDMGATADKITTLLASAPSKADVVALAIELGVPPSRRSTRAAAIRALDEIARDERGHDAIARLASKQK